MNFDTNKKCSINLQNLMSLIIQSAEKHIPSSFSSHLTLHNPWWNEKCKAAKRNKNRARRRFLRSKDPSDMIDYKRLKAIAQKTYNTSKRESWQSYLSKINSETPIKQIWKRVNKI